jgi:hypothetical protein
MLQRRHARSPWALLGAIVFLTACEDKPAANLAPAASTRLAPALPASSAALRLPLSATSTVGFVMDAPLEKIEGEAPGSVSGELQVDLADLRRSSGLIKIDLDRLELFQQKRSAAGDPLGERRRNELQNAHARSWLELEPKPGAVSEAQAKDNRLVEFRVERLVELSASNVLELSGAERRVTATVIGDLRLHGRKAATQAKTELLFKFAGQQLSGLGVRSLEAVPVSLAQFDVHPRDATGKLLQTVSEAIGGKLQGKLAAEARVSFVLVATP